MSAPDSESDCRIVPYSSQELVVAHWAENRILCEMVETSLSLVRGSTVDPDDLDALVREARRLYHSKGDGMTDENIRAFELFHRAAKSGFADAQHCLGFCYEQGQVVPQDHAEAAKWYRKSAEQGHANGQMGLGYCYNNGHGVPQDYVEAAKWYRKAADQGAAAAQYNLGSCYEQGHGVPVDMLQSYKWYRLSADQGDIRAASDSASSFAS